MTEYLVIARIGGSGDPEIYLPGSKIKLANDVAPKFLEAGLVRAIESTAPLPAPEQTTTVHAAAEAPKAKAK